MLASAAQGLFASRSSLLLTRASSPDRKRVSHRVRKHEIRPLGCRRRLNASAVRSGLGARVTRPLRVSLADGSSEGRKTRRRARRVPTVVCIHAHVAAPSDALLASVAIFDVAVRELVNNGGSGGRGRHSGGERKAKSEKMERYRETGIQRNCMEEQARNVGKPEIRRAHGCGVLIALLHLKLQLISNFFFLEKRNTGRNREFLFPTC